MRSPPRIQRDCGRRAPLMLSTVMGDAFRAWELALSQRSSEGMANYTSDFG